MSSSTLDDARLPRFQRNYRPFFFHLFFFNQHDVPLKGINETMFRCNVERYIAIMRDMYISISYQWGKSNTNDD